MVLQKKEMKDTRSLPNTESLAEKITEDKLQEKMGERATTIEKASSQIVLREQKEKQEQKISK